MYDIFIIDLVTVGANNYMKTLKTLLIAVFAITALVGFTSVVVHACTTAAECATIAVDYTQGASKQSTIGDTIKMVVQVAMYILGSIAVIMIIVGGIKYATSQGDSSSLQSAKNTILYSVIGLVVALAAYAIVSFVVSMLGGTSGNATPNPVKQKPVAPGPAPTAPAPTPIPTPAPVTPKNPTVPAKNTYRNGSYSAKVAYSPKGLPDTIVTNLTISNDKVTAVSIVDDPSNAKSKRYVDSFKSALSGAVVGKSLSGLSLSRVGGASLTTPAFNQTLDAIRNQAKQ